MPVCLKSCHAERRNGDRELTGSLSANLYLNRLATIVVKVDRRRGRLRRSICKDEGGPPAASWTCAVGHMREIQGKPVRGHRVNTRETQGTQCRPIIHLAHKRREFSLLAEIWKSNEAQFPNPFNHLALPGNHSQPAILDGNYSRGNVVGICLHFHSCAETHPPAVVDMWRVEAFVEHGARNPGDGILSSSDLLQNALSPPDDCVWEKSNESGRNLPLVYKNDISLIVDPWLGHALESACPIQNGLSASCDRLERSVRKQEHSGAVGEHDIALVV